MREVTCLSCFLLYLHVLVQYPLSTMQLVNFKNICSKVVQVLEILGVRNSEEHRVPSNGL